MARNDVEVAVRKRHDLLELGVAAAARDRDAIAVRGVGLVLDQQRLKPKIGHSIGSQAPISIK